MNELTKRVEQWYRENREKLDERFSKAEFHDKTDWDPKEDVALLLDSCLDRFSELVQLPR